MEARSFKKYLINLLKLCMPDQSNFVMLALPPPPPPCLSASNTYLVVAGMVPGEKEPVKEITGKTSNKTEIKPVDTPKKE